MVCLRVCARVFWSSSSSLSFLLFWRCLGGHSRLMGGVDGVGVAGDGYAGRWRVMRWYGGGAGCGGEARQFRPARCRRPVHEVGGKGTIAT